MDSNYFDYTAPEGATPPPPPPEKDTFETPALIAGIVSLISLFMCFALCISLPGSIAGMVFARISRAKQEGRYSSKAQAGMICSVISFVGSVLAIAFCVLLVVFVASVESTVAE